MADMPSGAVTFLFTDIEGSTRLVKHLRERYAGVLADQQRLLRAAFDAHDGYEVDTQGDSFFVAFSRARDALLAAVDGTARSSVASVAGGRPDQGSNGNSHRPGGRERRPVHGARGPSRRTDRERRARWADPRLSGHADSCSRTRRRTCGSHSGTSGSSVSRTSIDRSGCTRLPPMVCLTRSRRSAGTCTRDDAESGASVASTARVRWQLSSASSRWSRR